MFELPLLPHASSSPDEHNSSVVKEENRIRWKMQIFIWTTDPLLGKQDDKSNNVPKIITGNEKLMKNATELGPSSTQG